MHSSFLHRGLYIRQLHIDDRALRAALHMPVTLPSRGRLAVEAKQFVAGRVKFESQGDVATPCPGFMIAGAPTTPGATWQIMLEGVLAYRGPIRTGKSITV